MKRSFSLVWLGGLLATLASAPARAATQDAAAQELADQAIFTDYLQLDFTAAEKKLKKAIQLCERGTCSANVTAQVYRDLAVIYVTGMKRSDAGRELLVKALRLDARLALDADLTTPELIRVFNRAKSDVAKEPKVAPEAGEEEAAEEASPFAAPPPKPGKGRLKSSKRPAQAEPGAEPALGTGSMDEPRTRGSVDCPPDFPGCEELSEEPEPQPEEPEPDLGARNWLTVALQQDFLMFSGESGVCGPDRAAELSCYRAGDAFRPGTADNTAGSGGSIAGGFRLATTRLLIGYDRILFPSIGIGLRVGYAIGGGPAEPNGAAFVPIHAEARGTYWFAPLQTGELRPYATLGGGLAQVDSSVTTQVVDRCDGRDPAAQCQVGQIPVDENGAPAPSRVTVWKKTGTTFAALGAGALYPLSENSGINAELKGVILFPSSGMSVSLQAGYVHGF